MGCVAAKVNITLYERGTFDRIFQWKTGEDETPVDMTGYSAVFTVREKLTSSEALISIMQSASAWSADADSGVYFDDADEGKYRIYVNDADTRGICAEHKDIDGVYDLFLINVSGETVLKQYGKCALKAAVAR